MNKKHSIFRYPWFLAATLTPILISGLMAYSIMRSDGLVFAGWDSGSAAFTLFWDSFKVPLATLSLAVPLGAWAIANWRSKEFVASLEKQEAALEKQAEALKQQREMLEFQKEVFEAQEVKRGFDLYLDSANYYSNLLYSTPYIQQKGEKELGLTPANCTLIFERLYGQPRSVNGSGHRKFWPLELNHGGNLKSLVDYAEKLQRLDSDIVYAAAMLLGRTHIPSGHEPQKEALPAFLTQSLDNYRTLLWQFLNTIPAYPWERLNDVHLFLLNRQSRTIMHSARILIQMVEHGDSNSMSYHSKHLIKLHSVESFEKLLCDLALIMPDEFHNILNPVNGRSFGYANPGPFPDPIPST